MKKDKGILWWRKRWYSFCSMHYDHRKDCKLCEAGSWHNVWKTNIMGLFFKINPRVWQWLNQISS